MEKVEALGGEPKANCKPGDVIVRVDPRYYRPTEVETLLGDPTKAKQKLGWVPRITLPELVKEMVQADYTAARRDSLVKLAGSRRTTTTSEDETTMERSARIYVAGPAVWWAPPWSAGCSRTAMTTSSCARTPRST